MYLFSSSLIPYNDFNTETQQRWEKKLSSFFLSNNQILHRSYPLGDWQFQLTLVLPPQHHLMRFTAPGEQVIFYLLGDPGFRTAADFIDSVVGAYKAGHFDRLSELPLLYNLIIIDQKINKVFFICDSYHCQTLFYHQHKEQFIVTNTQKGIVSCPGFVARFDEEEVNNTLLLGTQFPEKTLIQGINRISPGYYLAGPGLECKKIIHSYPDKNYNLSMDDCVETIYQLSLEALEPWTQQMQLGVLFSGGNDSTSVARLMQQKTNNKAYYLSYFANERDMNRLNVEAAHELLNLKSNSVHYSAESLIKTQATAIWHGESELVGLSSLNVALEMALAHSISSKTKAWTGGDYYQLQLKRELNTSTSVLSKFRAVLKAGLLTEGECSLLGLSIDSLKLWNNIKNRIMDMTDGEVTADFYMPIYPSALYRLRNRSINFSTPNFFLNRDNNLNQFMATIPSTLTQQSTSNCQGKITVLLHEVFKRVLGVFYETRQKKAWMESLINNEQQKTIKEQIKQQVLYESPHLKELFGSSLPKIVEAEQVLSRYDNVLFCLWSMELFARQFFTVDAS